MGQVTNLTTKLRRDRARELRKNQTRAEARLWESLRGRRLDGWKWRRQVSIGPFIVDFVCREAGVAVELDGGVHAQRPDYDARRDARLAQAGLMVLRFDNALVAESVDHVRWEIARACRETDPAFRGVRVQRR